MSVDIAVPTWKMLLAGRYKYIDDWCNFIENDYKKAIQKDTWNLFYDFIQAVGDNLSLYSEDQAWPIAIDTFVEKLKKTKK
jgi:DCN1-like protein 1/2